MRASLSEKKYAPRFISTLMANAMYKPWRPAIAWPPTSRIAVRTPSRIAVFRAFISSPLLSGRRAPAGVPARRAGLPAPQSSLGYLAGDAGLLLHRRQAGERKPTFGCGVHHHGLPFAKIARDQLRRQ